MIHNLEPKSVESPTPQNGIPTTDTLGPAVTGLQILPEVDSDSATSPRSRKRSAKAASLPDSIPPDEDLAGSRHKLLMTETDSEVYPLWDSPHVAQSPCSIPLPVSDGIGESSPEKPESVQLFAPTLGVKSKGLVPEGQSGASDSLPDYETPVISPDTSPSKTRGDDDGIIGVDCLTQENLVVLDNQSESLRVCDGSLADTEGSDNSADIPPLSFEANRSSHDFMANPVPQSMANSQSSEKGDKHDEPNLALEEDIMYFRTPPGILPRIYQIGITLEVVLRKGKSTDWWELDLRGLPTLGNSESGYLYFRTNPGQGMEFGTQTFKRTTVVENCLMAQFVPGKNLVIPLRNCNAEHYGFINDYRINSVIHSEIFHNTSGYTIEYTAICSVDLINHRFWSEQCSFRMFVHGGHDGKYSGRLDAEHRNAERGSWSAKPCLYHLWLDPLPGAEIGVSRVELTCPPASLEMFAVQWEVSVPRGKVMTMPRIKNTYENEAETKLRNIFDFVDRERYVLAEPWVPGPNRTFWDMASLKRPSSSAHTNIAVRRNDVNGSTAKDLAVEPAVVTSLSVTEPEGPENREELEEPEKPAEPENQEGPQRSERPKKLHTTLHYLWRMMKLLTYACWLFSTLYQAYLTYLSLHNDYTTYDSVSLAHSGGSISEIQNSAEADAESGDIPSLLDNGSEQEEVLPMIAEPEPEPEPEPESEPMHVGKPHTGIPSSEEMSLRDRIDYFLGWKGPIAEE